MMAERELRSAIKKCLHRLFWVHVLLTHEPARFVGADRQDGEPERPVPLARRAEMGAFAVARIGNVIDAARWRLNDEGRPQRLIAVKQMARRPVPHRSERDRNARSKLDAIPPIVGLDADRRVVVTYNRVVTERRDDPAPMRGREPRQRRDIEMVVMAMR